MQMVTFKAATQSSSDGGASGEGGPSGDGGAHGDAGPVLTPWQGYASGETGTPTLEFEVQANSQESGGVFATPVASDDLGSIYLIWMDPNATVMVARKDPSGQVTTSVIETNSLIGPDHHNSSSEIDKYGYLHVVWGMHNSPWKYKVSTAPRDITKWDNIGPLSEAPSEGGAQNVRGVPGNDISYASFFKDRDGDLYLAFRHGVYLPGWNAGHQGGALARYSANPTASDGRWTMLGGTNYRYGTNPDNQPWGGRTLLWTGLDGVVGDAAYQSYMISHYVGHDGRIHIAWAFDENNTQGWEINHIGYAVSSDKGETWSEGKKRNACPGPKPGTPRGPGPRNGRMRPITAELRTKVRASGSSNTTIPAGDPGQTAGQPYGHEQRSDRWHLPFMSWAAARSRASRRT
jgi:hypothetical protein